MKHSLCILLILTMFSQLIQGQVIEKANNNSQYELYDFHMLKHKKNKTAAWILVGSGVITAVAGLTINGTETVATTFVTVITLGQAEIEKERKGDTFIYVGAAATVASIPFFISAGKHKRKATLSLNGEQNLVGNRTIYKPNNLAVSLKIDF